MKKNLLLLACCLTTAFAQAQESFPIKPYTTIYSLNESELYLPEINVAAPDLSNIEQEDMERDRMGKFYRMAVHVNVDIDMNNAGSWTLLPNGDRLWRLKLSSNSAKATMLYFDRFFIPDGARMHVYSEDKTQMQGAYTSYNNHESGLFATSLIKGETSIIEYYEPVEVAGTGYMHINEFGYVYRAANYADADLAAFEFASAASDPCEVDVKCPEGNDWADQIRGCCRILVKVGTSSGWCSGSAINNTSGDCTPYILTAQHCGEGATTSDFNQWRYYFNYQKSGCGTGTGSASQSVLGSALRANSNDVSGSSIMKSDFILVESNNNFPAAYNVFLNGWDNNNTTSSAGVSIHHPAGDFKKISTYTSNLVSSAWSGTNTHWRVVWAATTTNHGVTEGGSSGSPIFRFSNKCIMGQLSGGSSFCTSPTAPDLYGKFSYSWTSCGTTSNRQLQPWLDPTGSGVTTLAGQNNSCTSGETEYAIENIFTIFPNPAIDQITIETTGQNETLHTATIYDQTGKLVTSIEILPGKTTRTISLSELSNGVYSICISNNERSFTRKFVKL